MPRQGAAGLGEEAAAEAAALVLGAEVELVDLARAAAARSVARGAAAAEGGVAGERAVAVEDEGAEAARVHAAPPGRAAAGDHPLEASGRG